MQLTLNNKKSFYVTDLSGLQHHFIIISFAYFIILYHNQIINKRNNHIEQVIFSMMQEI